MDLNSKIEYLQRLGDKTEFKDILNNNTLIRILFPGQVEGFVKELDMYGKRNGVTFNSEALLDYRIYPTQIRFMPTKNNTKFNVLVFGSIGDLLLENLLKGNKAISVEKIHFEKDL